MKNLNISVTNKIAKYLQRDGVIVCGNSDYQITFTFDAEWDAYPTKTARFIWNGKYWDQPFTGNVCPVPIIQNAVFVIVGVYAGDLRTTTPASITCKRSILCDDVEINDVNIEVCRELAVQAAYRAEAAAAIADAANPETQRAELEAYIEEKTGETNAMVIDDLAKRTQLKPEFVQSLEELEALTTEEERSKFYVLLDETSPNHGYIYAYMYTEKAVGGYNNIAEPLPDNKTDTSKWINNCRISSSGLDTTSGSATNKTVCNPIPIKTGDFICVKGVSFVANVDRIMLTAEPYTTGNQQYVSALPNSEVGYGDVAYDLRGDVHVFTIDNAGDTFTHIRFAFTTPTNPEDVIITVGEEIVEGTIIREYAWANTYHSFIPNEYDEEFVALNKDIGELKADVVYLENADIKLKESIKAVETKIENIGETEIPDYWQSHLDKKIATIKNLHKQYGKDCFSFVFITDTHYPSNLGKISPLLAKKIMDETNIKFVLHGGDAQTRGCKATKDEILAENEEIRTMFAPILDRMLFAEGNHDGSYGTVNGVTYAQQLTENEMFDEYYRRLGLVGDIHFADDCSAYYIDDTASKVRYICLNSQCVPNSSDDVNADGSAKYCKFRALNFTQKQFDFLKNEALTDGLTDKWRVVVFGHIYIHEGQNDFALMSNFLSAYQNKKPYSGNYGGAFGVDAVSVDVNFTNAKGKLVGYFSGHNHLDTVHTPSSGVKVITTRCDAKEENDGTLNAERVAGTTTEQSFDVFTVTSDRIYATKIGAGSNRGGDDAPITY